MRIYLTISNATLSMLKSFCRKHNLTQDTVLSLAILEFIKNNK